MTNHSQAKADSSLRDGARLGLLIGTGIWVWLAVVDAVSGQPFRTFAVLGGIIPFTVVHFLLNVAYGMVIVAAMRGAARAPSLIIAVLVGVVMLEIAFTMGTVLLAETILGPLAWVRILGGSLFGTAIVIVVLARDYPLVAMLREAEHDR
ncbi:MAG: hypothetical protein ACT4P7_04375 [Gemmatimonadaceae bacterium]